MNLKQLLLGWRFLSVLKAEAEVEFHPICRLEGQFDLPGVMKMGDVDIGGIFSVHFSFSEPDLSFRKVPDTLTCTSFSLRRFWFLQTMIFTIEEINRNNKLLPNVTLGYRIYDGCNVISQSVRAAISMTTGTGKRVYNCEQIPLVPVIIGASMSTQSIAVATLMGVFNIPMISYLSTCACLSNKHDYPTFLRIVPSDLFQSRALAQLVKHFKWTWIGIIAEDSDYGLNAISLFKDEAKRLGTCVAFTEIIPTVPTPRKVSQIVNSISVYKVKVVLLFSSDYLVQIIFQEVVYQNITGIQWIASEAWVTSNLFSNYNFHTYLVGTIGFAIRRAEIIGLKSFLLKVHPSQHKNNPLVDELWEEIFNCSLGRIENVTNISKMFCSALEDLNSRDNTFLDVITPRISYNVYKGVYAFAHALHNMLALEESNGPFVNGTHINLDPWKLLKYLKRVNFTTSAGDKVNFDQNGDPNPSYDLVNWQKRNNGSVVFVPVGEFNEDGNLRVDEDVIIWQGAQKEVPISVCSKDCPPGSRKAVQPGMHPCCFDCISCDYGEISNQTNSLDCIRCPLEYWSNKMRDQCVPKELEYISFKETLGSMLFGGALLGICLTVLVVTVFAYHRHSPIVKANNSDLSFCILVSIALCFLSSITFIGQPTALSCVLRHTGFGISFALCMSCILGKTIVVLIAFNVQLPGSNVASFFSPSKQKALICLCITFQIIICATWNIVCPPWPVKRITYAGSKIILQCDPGSVLAFSLVLGYIGILVCICFILAFCAQNLPSRFNEAKLITFSMAIFSAVWIAFIPAYLSSPGKYLEAVEMFAILSSNYGLLACMFAPKCYIILLKPEKNDKKHIRSRNGSGK
ncbi:extracellular calcium-sensing receptor-like [Ascaphus truei]|uniref:extracellular calcium-sensing receptor-like n=1 Tax=Ascaphus truei TaxID=8439 RepID=UPI003F5A6524